jgi:glycosyltransferase involved in cell wall biosynthesis
VNSNLPRISVVTPSFNQAKYLETTIQSVLGQNYPNLEYFLMDGGSNDGSVEIIERYADKFAHWQSAKDAGQSDALNQGFARATGDIFCWVNSDDYFLPGAFHRIAELLGPSAGQPALAYGACLFFDDAGRNAKVVRPQPHDPAVLRTSAYIIQPSSFWTRTLWEKTGPLDSDLHFGFDWEWFIRASQHADFIQCPEIFSAYRHHAAHKSGSGGSKRLEEIQAIVRKHGTPEDVASFVLAQELMPEWERRSNVASTLTRWGRSIARALAAMSTPKLWRAPQGADAARLERARRMLS